MYEDVNFNRPSNILYYNKTMKRLNKLNDDQIDYIIYIDNYSHFRKIIINVMGKTIHVKNMYF